MNDLKDDKITDLETPLLSGFEIGDTSSNQSLKRINTILPWYTFNFSKTYFAPLLLSGLATIAFVAVVITIEKFYGFTLGAAWILAACSWLGLLVFLNLHLFQTEPKLSRISVRKDGVCIISDKSESNLPALTKLRISNSSLLTWFGLVLVLEDFEACSEKACRAERYFIACDTLSDKDYRRLCAIVISIR